APVTSNRPVCIRFAKPLPLTDAQSPGDPPRSVRETAHFLSPRVPMEPVFDQTGQVVAWWRGDHVLDLKGRHVAFLRGNWVISNRGAYLGRLYRGWFRDLTGAAVGFVQGARGTPLLPATQPPPPAPEPGPTPTSPLVSIPPSTKVPM